MVIRLSGATPATNSVLAQKIWCKLFIAPELISANRSYHLRACSSEEAFGPDLCLFAGLQIMLAKFLRQI